MLETPVIMVMEAQAALRARQVTPAPMALLVPQVMVGLPVIPVAKVTQVTPVIMVQVVLEVMVALLVTRVQ
jgi:hypothetical protein